MRHILKLKPDGTFHEMRIYDKDHYLVREIAYHPEPKLTGNHSPVLHIHYYNHDFNRTNAKYLNRATFEKYKIPNREEMV